jgi:hypothetical protein
MSEFTKYISIIAIIISIIVGVYVYREMSNTRARVGEIKFLKNNTVTIESRMADMGKQIKALNDSKGQILYRNDDSCSTSSEEYDVLESSSEDEYDNDNDKLSTISENDENLPTVEPNEDPTVEPNEEPDLN